MMNRKFLFFAIITGVTYFLTFNSLYILNPVNYEWLGSGPDSMQHYIGWAYFRHTPLLQYPIGLNPLFSMAENSTIVYSDSIPLLAFFFKLFNPVLPEYFQYFGWWILACFILQVYFSLKLLSTKIENKYIVYIGSIFFLFNNSFILHLRIAGGQLALFGQWFVIAALYFSLDKKFSMTRWAALVILSVLIHAYIAAMVITIFLVDFAFRLYRKEISLKVIFPVAGTFLCLFAVMHAVGYFESLGGSMITNIDINGHIFSLIDPDGSTHLSEILPIHKLFIPVYIGTGVILLYIYLIFSKTEWRKLKLLPIPLIIVCILMYIYSWGPSVGIGEKIIFNVPLIPGYKQLIEFFRNPQRFAWPVMYLSIFVALYLFSIKKLSNRFIVIFLTVLISLQFLDHMRDHKSSRRRLEATYQNFQYVTLNNIDNISFVVCENSTKDDFPFLSYIAAHNIPSSCIYRARLSETTKSFNKSIYLKGEYEESALYLLHSQELIDLIKQSQPDKIMTAGKFTFFKP